MLVEYLFYALFFTIPLIFYPKTSEVFEFNKMVAVYIFTVLILSAWIIKMIVNKKIIFRRTILDIPILIFLGTQLISTVFSIDSRTSFFGYYSRFNGGLLSLTCYCLLYWAFVSNMNQKKTIYSMLYLISSGLIVTIYGILEHFGHSFSCLFVTGKFDVDCWVQDVKTRIFATLGQPNWMAAYLVALLPISFSQFLRARLESPLISKKNFKKMIWLIVTILFFLATLFTKSRSGLLALVIADLIFWFGILFINFKKKVFKQLLIIFGVIHFLFLIAILIFGTPITPSLGEFIQKREVQQTTDTYGGGTDSGIIRTIVWKGAIDIAKHYPFFGTGVETFAYSYWQFRPIAHNNTSEWDFLYNKAHNEYLNYLANTGVVGLGSYFVLIIFSIVQIVKTKNSIFKIAVLAGYISILVTNFFGFSVVIINLLFFVFPAVAKAMENSKTDVGEKKIKLDNRKKLFIILILLFASYLLFAIVKYWYADRLYQKAKNELTIGEYQLAIKDIQSATTYIPDEPIYHNEMARILTEVAVSLADNKEATSGAQLSFYAIGESNKAFNLSARNMNVRQSRISMFLQFGSFDPAYLDEALSLTNETISLSPTDPKLDLLLGKIYVKMNKIKEAINSFQKAIDLKPDYQDAIKAKEMLEGLVK